MTATPLSDRPPSWVRSMLLALGFAALATVSVFALASVPTRSDLTEADQKRVDAVTALPTDFSKAEAFETMSGGAATSRAIVNANAFSQFSANLSFADQEDFRLGNALFRKLWVSSPASTQASDGLGPLFNARSCQRCHIKDGRGHPHAEGSDIVAVPMLMRLAIPPRTETEIAAIASGTMQRIPEPTYGGQIQPAAVPGLTGEATVRVTYEEEEIVLNGGEVVSVRHPTYHLDDLGYGSMDPEVTVSPRVAPPVIGLGLLEAIAVEDILAQADPEDLDGDGISGRPSWFVDPETNERVLGRFGWKASNPTVRRQSADAFNGDIGISNPLFQAAHGDCTEAQTACLEAPTGVQERLGPTEAPDPVLELVTFYAENLAVPARRDVNNPDVLRGKEIFHAAGCASCHTPKYVTSRTASHEAHRFQLIWPYTDMLLHDMGEGLADGQTVGSADGQEWRTPPLWGIGLTETVNGHTFFLHDGRARNVLEAIIWHGGEAQAARDYVADLAPEDRAALIRFLNSL